MIRFGLVAIKNIGELSFIQLLMQERAENGPFTGFEEFCRRMSGKELNRRAVESLIKAGAFDSLGCRRKALMQMTDGVLECIASDGRRNIDGQLDLFGLDEAGEPGGGSSVPVPDVAEYSSRELMAMERETTGLYLSGHPIDDYREAARRAGAVSIGAGHVRLRLPRGAGALPGRAVRHPRRHRGLLPHAHDEKRPPHVLHPV
ncbi:MAG: hypothetical protein ACLTSG_10935 [Lachnospiraceae bacterium]